MTFSKNTKRNHSLFSVPPTHTLMATATQKGLRNLTDCKVKSRKLDIAAFNQIMKDETPSFYFTQTTA